MAILESGDGGYSDLTAAINKVFSGSELANPISRAQITTSNNLNTWRQFTNLLAEDIEDLSEALREVNLAGAPLDSPEFTGNIPRTTNANNPTNNQELTRKKYVDDQVATKDNYGHWAVQVNSETQQNINTQNTLRFLVQDSDTSAIEFVKTSGNSISLDLNLANLDLSKDGTIPNAVLPDLVVGDFANSAVQLSTEIDANTFGDNDTSFLTAAAVNERISTRLAGFSTSDLDINTFITGFGFSTGQLAPGTGLDGAGNTITSSQNIGKIPAITLNFNELSRLDGATDTNANDYFIVGDNTGSGTTISAVPKRAKFSTIDILRLNYNNKITLNNLAGVQDSMTLTSNTGATGSILRYQNNEWQPSTAPLSDTTYDVISDGGLEENASNQFGLKDASALSANKLLQWDNTNNKIINSGIDISSTQLDLNARSLELQYVSSVERIVIGARDTANNTSLSIAPINVLNDTNFNTGTTTRKSFIFFGSNNSSNDKGIIYHESSASQNNVSTMHICPGDDLANDDSILIHGYQQNPDTGLRLATSGKISQLNSLTLLNSPNGGTSRTVVGVPGGFESEGSLRLPITTKSTTANNRIGGILRLQKGSATGSNDTDKHWEINTNRSDGDDDFYIYNESTEVFKIDRGTGAIIAAGMAASEVSTNRTLTNKEYVDNADALRLLKSGGTMSGGITMGANKITATYTPSAGGDLTTKTYVDTKLPKAGGTMTGAITMGANKITATYTPSANSDLTTKTYVDGKLAKSGGTMSGAIAMGSNKITGLGTPTASTDATTKTYVDSTIDTKIDNAQHLLRPKFTLQYKFESIHGQHGLSDQTIDHGSGYAQQNDGHIKFKFTDMASSGFRQGPSNKYYVMLAVYNGFPGVDGQDNGSSFDGQDSAGYISTTTGSGDTTLYTLRSNLNYLPDSGVNMNVDDKMRFTVHIVDLVSGREYITRLPQFVRDRAGGSSEQTLTINHVHNATTTGAPSESASYFGGSSHNIEQLMYF